MTGEFDQGKMKPGKGERKKCSVADAKVIEKSLRISFRKSKI